MLNNASYQSYQNIHNFRLIRKISIGQAVKMNFDKRLIKFRMNWILFKMISTRFY